MPMRENSFNYDSCWYFNTLSPTTKSSTKTAPNIFSTGQNSQLYLQFLGKFTKNRSFKAFSWNFPTVTLPKANVNLYRWCVNPAFRGPTRHEGGGKHEVLLLFILLVPQHGARGLPQLTVRTRVTQCGDIIIISSTATATLLDAFRPPP